MRQIPDRDLRYQRADFRGAGELRLVPRGEGRVFPLARRRLRLDRDDTLDLDRDLVWQHDVADRGAGMPSGFTEHFDK